MHSETQRTRFVLWVFIFFTLTLGAGVYWFSSGEYQGQAAETINASKETVMTNTLIGYWTLDGNDIVWGDTTSEIKDVNPGTKHHGNSSNLAAGSARPGRTGQGLLFNGTSDTVSLGNVYNGVKTVSFWVKPNTTTQSLIDLNATATVDINAGTVRGNNFTTPTIYVDGAATATFPDTEWHHIAVTTATGINASAAYIGQIASAYFGGTIDDIRFYSDALTATQVADLYRASSAKEISNANHRESLTNGLVGYWTMDGRDTKWSDTSTEIKDISGNNNHGNASGLTTASVTPGKLGQGMNFDGSGDYFEALPITFDASLGNTWSVWIKPANFTAFRTISIQCHAVTGNCNPTAGFDGIYWYAHTTVDADYGPVTEGVSFAIITDGGSRYLAIHSTDNRLMTNVWHHVVMTYDGSLSLSNRLTIYVNGIDVTNRADVANSGTISSTMSLVDTMRIGGRFDTYPYFSGQMDDYRIYNRALTVTEVVNLYSIGR